MALLNQFSANQNKGLLWKIMMDNNAFDGIPSEKSALVREEFDSKIRSIGSSINRNDNLVSLNKRAIIELLPEMEKYKTTATATTVTATRATAATAATRATAATAATTATTAAEATMVYNAGDLLQQRQKVFENELKQKQNEFENFNAKPVPDKIDFADKLDTPMGAEMDRILAEQIALRERQLTLVGPPPPAALETKGGVPPPAKQALQPPTKNIGVLTIPTAQALIQKEGVTTILKIGEEINSNIVINPLSPIRKKVNFIEPYEPDNKEDFMHFFKKTPSNKVSNEASNEIKEILLEILNKQREILLRLDAMAP